MGTRLWTLTALLLAASYLVGWASAYSRGAPDSACSSLMPGHGPAAQTTSSPFSLTPSTVSVEPGQRMLVTLESTTGSDRFMGFIVQARDAETDTVLGTFFTTDHNYLTCGPGFNNAVTHGGGAQKAKVVLEWEPKSDFQGDIVFKGSFVKDYSNYWVGVTSEKVTVVKREAQDSTTQSSPAITTETPATTKASKTTKTTTTPTTIAATPTASAAPTSIANSISSAMDGIYNGCESSKGCFGSSNNCVKNQNCDFLMTYVKSAADNGYRFEISGQIENDKGYVAGGLSFDALMGDDSVMICRTEEGITDVLMGWNTGKSNSLLVDPYLGITNKQTAFVDGRVYCSFVRNIETEILGNVFDLDNAEFNLMVASGPTQDSGIGWHSGGKSVTASQLSLGGFEAAETKSDLFKILHGTFMIGAWICAASLGILMARYFKQTWLRNDCCSVAQWFHWHRFLMGLTWLLTMAGFGFIVYYLEGISNIDPTVNPHVVLGFISTGLCFIQPFMALMRCSPQDSKRPIFNWLHWFVGNSAQIVGITAIFFGLQLWVAPTWTMWLLIIFVAFHCLVHLILSIGQCVSDSKAENTSNVFPMKDMNGSRNPLHPVDKKDDAPGTTFRKTMLTFYIIVNILITAALILVVYPGADQLKDWGLIFWEQD